MNRVTLVVILTSYLIMTATSEQRPPKYCSCYLPTTDSCTTRGCSNGTNVYCNAGIFFPVISYGDFGPDIPTHDLGSSCPNNPCNITFNGYYAGYIVADPGGPFNYTTCTDFGYVGGHFCEYGNNATDCCNFCCNRNDPYPDTIRVSGN